ncbi:uncharacterized protein LOC111711573 [Eurytemora carolleeae]|uniref:uncharacterized protein LOC111711573 n=1 Tax=Eurytemora carolleeae TaxID=1294199 RepID=UPI000C76C74C|nr:uncharacterized protein LOC111711573 [Eurytemora carolleeae]|eukprot:XP_023341726.1 uncharacterized protein LOC111711573 [Eurytemora affinis]
MYSGGSTRSTTPVIYIINKSSKSNTCKVEPEGLDDVDDDVYKNQGDGGKEKTDSKDGKEFVNEGEKESDIFDRNLLLRSILVVFNCLVLPTLILVGPCYLVYILLQCLYATGVFNLILYRLGSWTGFWEWKKDEKYSKPEKHSSTSLQYSTADGTQTQDVQQDLLIESSMAENLSVQNETAEMAPDWKDCNIILIPLLTFLLLCCIIIYVLCRYRICGTEEKENEKDDEKK